MRPAIPFLALLLAATSAMAQDSPEARLREMLRRSAIDLRAARDSQTTLQASLDAEKQKSAALQARIDELVAHPPEPPKPSISEDEIAQLRADGKAARDRVAVLEDSLKQWRDAYQKTADIARAKDAGEKIATARAAEAERRAGVCIGTNTKLIETANDILHLYQSQDFRSLLVRSYEPLVGTKKVELENLIQDYEDKILERKYAPARGEARK